MQSLIEAFSHEGPASLWTWIWIASGILAVVIFLKTLDAGEVEPPEEPPEQMLFDQDKGSGHE